MFIKLAEERRSIRKYKDKPVEADKVDKIIETALRAPSGRGARPWHFVVVRNQGLKEQLSAARPGGGAFVKDASVAIVVCGDPAVSHLWVEDCTIAAVTMQYAAVSLGLGSRWFNIRGNFCKEGVTSSMSTYWQESQEMEQSREDWQGAKWKLTGLKSAEQDFKIAPVFIILYGDPRTQAGLPMGVSYMPHRTNIIQTSSLSNAFLYLHLAATSLGLASQWISSIQVPIVNCQAKELLNIPHQMEVFDMMALGYPAIKAREKFMRKQDKMVHRNVCDPVEFRTGEEVQDFVRRSRSWNIGTHSRKADQD